MDTRFELVAKALRGELGDAELVKFPREGEEKLKRRKEIAYYINYLLPACQRFAGYIEKRPPMRDVGGNSLLMQILDDCDWRGNSLSAWMQSFMIESKARGTMLALVDMPSSVPEDQASQIEQRAVPYLVPIRPEAVTEYRTDAWGRFNYIKWSETVWEGAEQKELTREWTDTGWTVTMGCDVVSQGEHGLGVCPVVAFSEIGDVPCFGPFGQIATLSVRILNLFSEADELIRSQTFGLLTYQIPPEMEGRINAAQIVEDIGTNNMLVYYGERPDFVSPNTGSVEAIRASIEQLETKIDAIAMNVEEPNHQESGIALTLRFQALNSALTGFARRMEDFERRVWDVACRWLRIENRTVVNWSKDYALADMATEMAILQQAQASAMPDGYIRAKMKQIVQLDMGAMEKADLEAIMAEIDAQEHKGA